MPRRRPRPAPHRRTTPRWRPMSSAWRWPRCSTATPWSGSSGRKGSPGRDGGEQLLAVHGRTARDLLVLGEAAQVVDGQVLLVGHGRRAELGLAGLQPAGLALQVGGREDAPHLGEQLGLLFAGVVFDVFNQHGELGHPGRLAGGHGSGLRHEHVHHVVLLQSLRHHVLQLVVALAHLGVEEVLLDRGVHLELGEDLIDKAGHGAGGVGLLGFLEPCEQAADPVVIGGEQGCRVHEILPEAIGPYAAHMYPPENPGTPQAARRTVRSGPCVAASCPLRRPTRSPATSTPPLPRRCWSRPTTWRPPTTSTPSPPTAGCAGSRRCTGAWCRAGPRTPRSAPA